MLGALPVIIDLGGTKPLGGICIYLGGTSDPQGNHASVLGDCYSMSKFLTTVDDPRAQDTFIGYEWSNTSESSILVY